MTNNPGVGLKLTAPRISSTSESSGPGPQTYYVPGSLHTTEREKAQNDILSKRYTNSASTHYATSSPSSSSLPLVTGSGQKRSREDEHDASKRHHSASK